MKIRVVLSAFNKCYKTSKSVTTSDSLMRGFSLKDPKKILENIKSQYFGSTKEALHVVYCRSIYYYSMPKLFVQTEKIQGGLFVFSLWHGS